MPKVAYSEEDRTRIREALITTALEPVSYTHLDVYKRQDQSRIS